MNIKQKKGVTGFISKYIFGKDHFKKFLANHIPNAYEKKSCIEIGCYPGGYLSFISSLGYVVSGVDYVDKMDSLMDKMQEAGISVGQLIKADFFTHEFQEKYDIVCSFGFVEHFNDYEQVILRHCKLVAENGKVVITAPNLNSKFINRITDKYRPDRRLTHNYESVNLEKWRDILEANDFNVTFCGYFGHDYFGLDAKSNNNFFLRQLFRVLRIIPSFMYPQTKTLSSYAGIVATKK